jgi:putative peptidoglycan lipid II flippase
MSQGQLRLTTSFWISGVTLAGVCLEVVKNSAIAFRYGAGAETDVFFTAFLIPNAYTSFWVSACSVGLVPLLSAWLGGKHDGASTVISQAWLFSGLLALLMAGLNYIFASYLPALIAPGFTEVQRQQATDLLREFSLLYVVMGVTGVATALLSTRYDYVMSAANKLVMNAVIVVGLLFVFLPVGIRWLAHLVIVGAALHAIILLWRTWQVGLRPRFPFAVEVPRVCTMMVAVLFPFVALLIRQASFVVERFLGSLLPAGSISVQAYSFGVVIGLGGVPALGITTQLLPALSQKQTSAKKVDLIWRAVYLVCVFLLPVASGFWFLSEPLVGALFHYGAFSEAVALEMTGAFRAYAPGLVFSSLVQCFQSIYWAERRYALIVVQHFLMVAANIVLDIALVRLMGVAGLALGYTVSAFVSAGVIFWCVCKDYGSLFGKLPELIGPCAATLVVIVVISTLRFVLSGWGLFADCALCEDVFQTLLLSGSGAVTYWLGAALLRVEPFHGALWAAVRAFRLAGRF